MSDLRMELIQGQLNDIEENVRSIKATWGNTIMTLDNIKSGLKADRQKAIDEAYQNGLSQGYKDGYETGRNEATTLEYQRGLGDAWEAAKKICTNRMISDRVLAEIFGQCKDIDTIMHENTAQEAINKLKAYEEQQKTNAEIKVGDEVMSNNAISDHTGVVLALSPGENSAKVLENDGSMAWVAVNVLIKTGRHFNFLTPLLNEMKEGAE